MLRRIFLVLLLLEVTASIAFAELKQIQDSNNSAKTLAFSEQMLKL